MYVLPIFESLRMDESIRQVVLSRAGEASIRTLARQAGGGSLLESGARRVMEGITTADDVLEATFSGVIGI